MFMKKFGYLLCLAFFLSVGVSYSQEQSSGFNPNSVYPVHESYVMYKKTLWRRMDLREKQNAPFYATNGELPTIIINAVKAGLLFPYVDDSVKTRMDKQTFQDAMKLPEAAAAMSDQEKEIIRQQMIDSGELEEGQEMPEDEEADGADEFNPKDFAVVEIKEDVYFDRMRSRLYYDIHSLTLILPSDPADPSTFERPLASFKYKELEALFKSMPKEALWYNSFNMAEHRNFADAFNLRLFSANLTKFANTKDESIVEIYQSRKKGMQASQKIEHDMLEFENELWEF
jgi:gliding motility associated protien GldN